MMKQVVRGTIAIPCVAAVLGSSMLFAQATRGDWPVTGGDPGQNRWQKAESKLSPETVPSQFKFLFKIQLGKPSEVSSGFTEPLLAPRLINALGFKDIVFWSSADSLYAVDSELGNLMWTKHFDVKGHGTGCATPTISLLIEPPVVINFAAAAARRPPGTPPPPQAPPLAPENRRLGVPPGGGGFGLKGIYALTNDGLLHEQVLTTGDDFAQPVKFFPAGAHADALNIVSKTVYVATGHTCPAAANGLSTLDMATTTYPVATIATGRIQPLASPAIAPDGTAFILTGPGGSTSPDIYPNSVLAIGRDLKPRDWYTPTKAGQTIQTASPTTFPYKGKQYVVAPTQSGTFVLLDANFLGGPDHHTPLSETAAFSAPTGKHPWDGFATWIDKDGLPWVFASISAPIVSKEKSATTNGLTTHGGIVAFRIDEADQKPILNPIWISADMLNPAPPVVANGVLITLAGGDSSTHATLTVLNATTGKQLFSSRDTIPTYTHLSGVAAGDGHAFFTDHSGTLYSFGIGIEH